MANRRLYRRVREGLRRHPRTLAICVLAIVLSGWAVGSFPPKPEQIFQRTTSEGIDIDARWTAPERSFSEENFGPSCYGARQLQVGFAERARDPANRTSAWSSFNWPLEVFQDSSAVLSVASWGGSGGPPGRKIFVFTVVRAGPSVSRVRASFPGSGTDEMVPVRGWAALAVWAHLPLAGSLMGKVEALDVAGRVIATVDRQSARQIACL